MKHHLLIAGTGRAGTSLLVKYFDALGMNTHLKTSKDHLFWDYDAEAGLEDLIYGGREDLPYVVKTPWLYEFIDAVLERDEIAIDAVVIPVRDLAEAASSRIILELQSIHRNHVWFTDQPETWTGWSSTPGGAVYSLHPMDQARLLATGFHHLIERLTKASIPIYFVAFPKFTSDPQYLFNALKGCLPETVDLAAAVQAHEKVVDRDKVRVSTELSPDALAHGARQSPMQEVDLKALDNAALRRELIKVRRTLAQQTQEREAAQREIQSLIEVRTLNEGQRSKIDSLQSEIESLITSHQDLIGEMQCGHQSELDALRIELSDLQTSHRTDIEDMNLRWQADRAELIASHHDVIEKISDSHQSELDALRIELSDVQTRHRTEIEEINLRRQAEIADVQMDADVALQAQIAENIEQSRRIADLDSRNDALDFALAAMEGSRSWIVTRPLRLAAGLARKFSTLR